MNQYTITKLYMLPSYDARKRFDAFREERGQEACFAGEVEFNSSFVDQADTDEIDQAWLAGAGAAIVDGVRIPWDQDTAVSISHGPLFEFIREHRFSYTIWPSSHALLQMDHQLAAFVAEIWRKAEVLP